MKKSILFLAIASMAFVSCQKEDVAPEPTPVAPVVETTVTKSFATNGPAIVGQLYVFRGSVAGPNQVAQNGGSTTQMGAEGYSPGAVSYTFDKDSLYHIEFAVGSTFPYKGNITFDSNGNLTQTNLAGTNTVSLNLVGSTYKFQ